MTDNDLAAWLRNGEMARHNPDKARDADVGSTHFDGCEAVHEDCAAAVSEAQADVGPSEYDVQKAIFEWAEWQGNQRPELKLLYAVPNGQYREGQRMEPGLRKGMTDYVLPVPRDRFHGAYFELKVDDNQTSAEQDWWIERLREQGYLAMEVRGYDHAIAALEWYLSLEEWR